MNSVCGNNEECETDMTTSYVCIEDKCVCMPTHVTANNQCYQG